MIKSLLKILIVLVPVVVVSCKSSCPPDTVTYINPPFPPEETSNSSQSEKIDIQGKTIQVDEVITGLVCNDTWRGTVYVTCNIQIPAWEKDAFFFQDCDLDIEEGTVVYVEAHRNKPYKKGCTCHE
jgi:hypothetical protein